LSLLSAAALATPALAGEIVLAALPAGECTLRVETRTEEPQVLRVRALHPRYGTCRVDEASVSAALREALGADPRRQATPPYTSISFGRLVDYPWLSVHVARAAARDAGWNARAGRPVRGGVNDYVAGLLSDRAVTAVLEPALATGGYRVRGAAVEKVLIATADRIGGLGDGSIKGRLPFDAMYWLLVERP
jgi:hypothetical protein